MIGSKTLNIGLLEEGLFGAGDFAGGLSEEVILDERIFVRGLTEEGFFGGHFAGGLTEEGFLEDFGGKVVPERTMKWIRRVYLN